MFSSDRRYLTSLMAATVTLLPATTEAQTMVDLSRQNHRMSGPLAGHATQTRQRAPRRYCDLPRAVMSQITSTRSLRMPYIWSYSFTTGSQCGTMTSSLSPIL